MKTLTQRITTIVAGTIGALVIAIPVQSYADSYRWNPYRAGYHYQDSRRDRRELWHDRRELRLDQRELWRDQRAHRGGEVAQDRRELWNDRQELQRDAQRVHYNRSPG